MIIKSMARKQGSFRQLVDYIDRDAGGGGEAFHHNLYYSGSDRRRVAQQFYSNQRYLPVRQNGNALYHELLVLPPQPHLSQVQQKQVLHQLAREYCQQRAPKQMAWGRVHFDTEYPHIHLMIAANRVRSPKRARVSQARFAQIKQDLERYKCQTFPQLDHVPVQLVEERAYTPPCRAEGEVMRHTGRMSIRQQMTATLEDLLSSSPDQAALQERLKKEQLELYQRDQHWGVRNLDTGRKYRFKTLGLEPAFSQLLTGPGRRSSCLNAS